MANNSAIWLPIKIIAFYRKPRLLIFFCSILLILDLISSFLLPHPFSNSSIEEALKQLPAASSILTALVFAVILPKVAEFTTKRENELNLFKEKGRRLTAFRTFVQLYSRIDFFRNSITWKNRQDYLEGYGLLDLTGHTRRDPTMLDNFNSNVTEEDGDIIILFAAMRDFTFDPPYAVMTYNPYADSNYTLDKLEYLQRCSNFIWYQLHGNKDLREKINASFNSLPQTYKARMEELHPIFSGPNPKHKEISLIISDNASNFEQEIGTVINQLDNIIYKWSSSKFMPLAYDTLFIISFGVVIPILSILFNISNYTKSFISLICCSVTITFFYSFIHDLYILFSFDEYKNTLEVDEYDLVPPSQYETPPVRSWEKKSTKNENSRSEN